MKLPTLFINDFKQLSSSFLCHFVRGQHLKRPVDLLLIIKQGEKETLRSYMKRFTQETLEVDEVDEKMQLTAFKARLKSREFVALLVKNPSQTIAEMFLKAQKYKNTEDALAAIEEVENPNKKERKGDDQRG